MAAVGVSLCRRRSMERPLHNFRSGQVGEHEADAVRCRTHHPAKLLGIPASDSQADTRSSPTLQRWPSICHSQVLHGCPLGLVQPLWSSAVRIP